MPTRSVLLAAGLALGLALAGCGGDDDPAGSDPDTSLIPPESTDSETTGSTGTTVTTAPASTEPSTPTAFTTEAADAVNELKAAWETGDQARARAIAPGDVVDALFLVPPDGFEVQGCDTGEFDTSTCTFRNRATEAFIVVSAARSEAGWQIATIDVNED
ncbi:MAG TPA: hypothetical protein VF228_13130 [Iamia sp.]